MEASKQQHKDGISIFDGRANGGIIGHDMRPMDDPHPSDCFATIYGITNHEINNKHIWCYCAVSPPKNVDCLCIYPEYARVPEQPTSIHSGTQLWDYGNKISDFSTLLGGTNANLLPSQYDSILQDYVNGELYFDALEDIDSDLDKHPGHYVNIGDFKFSDNDPLSIY